MSGRRSGVSHLAGIEVKCRSHHGEPAFFTGRLEKTVAGPLHQAGGLRR